VLEPGEYAKPTTVRLLTDRVRPLLGGLQIRVNTTNGGGGSLGAVAMFQGATYLVIASHVADRTGNGGLGEVHQPSVSGGSNLIGQVSTNPAFVGGIPNCPTGQRCRLSDAALVTLATGVASSFGSVAAPLGGPVVGGGSGTLSFDDATPTAITDEGVTCSALNGCLIDLFPGDSASKIGSVTGWTGGRLVGSSQFNQGVDGLYRLQNLIVEGRADLGDSGSPVLAQSRDRIAGIQWGSSTVGGNAAFLYSAWPNVAMDLIGNQYRLHTAPPRLLGYEQRWINDASCPSNPDAIDVWIIHGYPDGAGGYETAATDYAGHSSYWCNGVLVDGDFTSSSAWQQCTAAYSGTCPCAFHTVGTDACPVLSP
jgi:hypothetical protein